MLRKSQSIHRSNAGIAACPVKKGSADFAVNVFRKPHCPQRRKACLFDTDNFGRRIHLSLFIKTINQNLVCLWKKVLIWIASMRYIFCELFIFCLNYEVKVWRMREYWKCLCQKRIAFKTFLLWLYVSKRVVYDTLDCFIIGRFWDCFYASH